MQCSAEGVTVKCGGDRQPAGEPESWTWAGVEYVDVYKRDLTTADLVCLLVGLQDGRRIEFDEDEGFWEDLVGALATYLPGVPSYDEWRVEVVNPPFARCERRLYTRASPQAARQRTRSARS